MDLRRLRKCYDTYGINHKKQILDLYIPPHSRGSGPHTRKNHSLGQRTRMIPLSGLEKIHQGKAAEHGNKGLITRSDGMLTSIPSRDDWVDTKAVSNSLLREMRHWGVGSARAPKDGFHFISSEVYPEDAHTIPTCSVLRFRIMREELPCSPVLFSSRGSIGPEWVSWIEAMVRHPAHRQRLSDAGILEAIMLSGELKVTPDPDQSVCVAEPVCPLEY